MPIVNAGLPVLQTSSARHAGQAAGGWLSDQRDRKGRPIGKTMTIAGKQVEVTGPQIRWLSYSEMWSIYRRVPDVRAAIDSVVRRVATWDWIVEPTSDPSDPDYELLLVEAETQRRFLAAPNTDGETWQELATKFTTDLLVFDQGALEPVKSGRGALSEIVALRGSTISATRDEVGHLIEYVQDYSMEDGYGGPSNLVTFAPDELVFFRLFPSTAGPAGNSLMETLIDEVITILRAAEHAMLAFDADEIPPGIVVLSGLAGKAAREAADDLREMKGQDHKIRVLTTPDPKGMGAAWVELRHTPKDLAMREIVNDIRRVIWRVFGVTPVEMGSTEDVNRSTAEVQLAVGSSHLVSPILEIVEAKINARILPLLASRPELVGKTRFLFDRDTKLSPAEQLQAAERLDLLVKAGIITRNEARSELGMRPVECGDVLTVEGTPRVLETVIEGEPEPGPAPDDEAGPGASNGETDQTDPEAGAPSEDDDAPGESGDQAAAARPCLHGHHDGTRGREMPSDWQPAGRFRGYRTLDLARLGDAISAYTRSVQPVWREARDEVLAAAGAAWSAERGGMTDDAAQVARDALDAALDKLELRWRAVTGPLYVEAAAVGRDAAADFTGVADAAEDYERQAEVYFSRAMSYLTAQGGPLLIVRRVVQQVLAAVTRARRSALDAAALDAIVDEAVLLATIEAAFNGQEFRLFNWAGRLNDLANDVMTRALDQLSVAEGRTITTWYAEWVYVGDKVTCSTCEQEGMRGIIPLAEFRTRPGAETECRGNCRCVLVLWTREEVDTGRAERLGPVEGT